MATIDELTTAIIILVRLGAVLRFIFCMVRLMGAEDEAASFKKRAKNTVIFWIVAECIWQIKDIVLYYYG